jgi:hypothetical protein
MIHWGRVYLQQEVGGILLTLTTVGRMSLQHCQLGWTYEEILRTPHPKNVSRRLCDNIWTPMLLCVLDSRLSQQTPRLGAGSASSVVSLLQCYQVVHRRVCFQLHCNSCRWTATPRSRGDRPCFFREGGGPWIGHHSTLFDPPVYMRSYVIGYPSRANVSTRTTVVSKDSLG